MFAAFTKNRSFDRIIRGRRAFARPARLVASNDNALTNRALRHPQRSPLVGRWQVNEASARLEWHWALAPAGGSEDPEPTCMVLGKSAGPRTREFGADRPSSIIR